MMKLKVQETFFEMGYKAGLLAGNSVTDGNTELAEYEAIHHGYHNDFCPVMDLCPNPLSGEWAGESIGEIFGFIPDDDDLNDYEAGFAEAFWVALIGVCDYHLQIQG